jgi:orotate phosphoribosyltransferase
VEAVVGPAMGGVLLAYEVARGLGARALFAEKADGGMALRRGFALKAGERVLVVEDVLTTGGSAGKVVDLVEERGARLVGVGVVVDRSGGRVTFGARRPAALFTMDLPAYEAEACPLCRQGVPLEAPKL